MVPSNRAPLSVSGNRQPASRFGITRRQSKTLASEMALWLRASAAQFVEPQKRYADAGGIQTEEVCPGLRNAVIASEIP